jgi:hypothetical protein
MKKLFLGVTAATALLASCQSDKPLDLKFQLPQGETVRYTADMNQNIDQTVMGNAMSIKQNMLFGMLYKVTGMEGTNRMVDVSYDRIKMETNAAGQSLKYDSKDTAGNNPALAMLGGMLGKTFRMTVSERGQVQKVEGFDAIINSMANDPANPNAAAMRQQLDQMFSDDAVKQMLEQSTNIYPDKAVKPGDTWTKTSTTNMGPVSLEIANTYKLESATDKTAHVSSNAVITGKSATGAGAMQGMTVNMKGKQTGKMDIEIATGMMEKMDVDQNIEGTIEMQDMKMPMKIKTTGTVTGEKVK